MTPTPEGLRERIAEAIGCDHDPDIDDGELIRGRRVLIQCGLCRRRTDAVLDALRLEQVGWDDGGVLHDVHDHESEFCFDPTVCVPVFVLRTEEPPVDVRSGPTESNRTNTEGEAE